MSAKFAVFSAFLIVVLGFIVPCHLFAQNPSKAPKQLEIEKLSMKPVATPRFSVSSDTASGKRKSIDKWLEIRSEYRVNAEWVDSAEFRYFVALEQNDPRQLPADVKRNRINVLTGKVVYEDMPRGRSQLSAMFLSPTKYFRYGKVIGFRVEVYVDGNLVSGDEKVDARLKKAPGWQKKSPKSLLLNRSQTPFAHIDRDSYNDIKIDTSR